MTWMTEAWSQIGVHATAGPAATPEIITYFHEAGHSEIVSDEVAWCAAFHNAMCSRAGVPLDAIPHDERLLARSCLKLGSKIDTLRVGATCVLSRTADPIHGHVGFVVGWSETHVQLLGGNQANSVSVASFDRSRIIGLRWPDAPATSDGLIASGSRITQASTRQMRDGATTALSQTVPPPPARLGIADLAGQADGLKGALETFEAFISFAGKKWPLIAGGLALFFAGRMAYDAWLIRQARIDDHNMGKTILSAPSEAA